MTHDYMADWTPEEREATKGMPPNIAVGFVAARRGTNVTAVHKGYGSVADQFTDLINKAQRQNGLEEADLREAFERLSAQHVSRPKPEGDPYDASDTTTG